MYYIVIDQGTSSTKGFLFNSKGSILHKNRIKHKLYKPKPFHIESDAIEIVCAIKQLFKEMIDASDKTPIRKAGISVQRSTFLFWEKKTKKPVTPAISWQDSRAKNIIKIFEKYRNQLWDITGSPLSAHFGGPKFYYFIKNNKKLKRRIENGEIFFGSLSAFIAHEITGTATIDHSIACRTLFYDITKGAWSQFLLNLFNVPLKCLPTLVPIKYSYGNILRTNIPLSIVIGDQQAALIGQEGWDPKSMGANFGTSGSIQYNVGRKPLKIKGLITSVLYSEENHKMFMVEGTINACNAVFYHLEEKLNIPHKKMKWDKRVALINTNGIFIPGFNGLASPYWKNGFKDILLDLDSDPNDIIRAAMESIGFLTNDIIECLKREKLKISKTISISGGAARPPLLQFISNVTGFQLRHFAVKDRTALGVYRMIKNDYKKNNNQIIDKIFLPEKSKNINQKKAKWSMGILKYNLNK